MNENLSTSMFFADFLYYWKSSRPQFTSFVIGKVYDVRQGSSRIVMCDILSIFTMVSPYQKRVCFLLLFS